MRAKLKSFGTQSGCVETVVDAIEDDDKHLDKNPGDLLV